MQNLLEVPANGRVLGDAAGEDHGLLRRLATQEGVRDVLRKPAADAVADLLQGEARLLRVHEVSARKHCAPRGDLRRRRCARARATHQLTDSRESEPPGLLIEEASRAGGAGGVRPCSPVASLAVELYEAELFTAHKDDGADVREEVPASGNQGNLRVAGTSVPEDRRAAGSDGHTRDRPGLDLIENTFQRFADLAPVGTVLEPLYFAFGIEKRYGD